jgi:hypothetical protein
MTAADHVTQNDLDTLASIATKARGASTDITNLSPEGQLLMLKHLQAGAEKTPAGSPERALAAQFESHLTGQSPALAAHVMANNIGAPVLAARQAQQDALSAATTKLSDHVANGGTLNARNVQQALDGLVGNGPHAHGLAGRVSQSLLDDLQNKAAVGSAGLKADVPTYGGILGSLAGHGGSNTAIAMSALHNPLHAVAMFGAKHILGKGQSAVNQAMVDLTHGPGSANKLADILEQIHLSKQASSANTPLRIPGVGPGVVQAANMARQ